MVILASRLQILNAEVKIPASREQALAAVVEIPNPG
jgi:hypothetical protein